MKRFFDIVFSAFGMVLLSPLFMAAALFIKLDSKGPVFYRQERIGKDFKPFRIYKFRTMTADLQGGPQITTGGDRRITRAGKILRKYKIDELPQLLNVFRGDMSFVGPRPEVKKYVDIFRADYAELLAVRPGITDPASVRYSKEEELLPQSDNWEDVYITRILPEKIGLSLNYARSHSLFTDLKLIVRTVLKVFHLPVLI